MRLPRQLALPVGCRALFPAVHAAEPFPVSIRVDATETQGELRPILALLRRRRAELCVHEGRPQASSATWANSSRRISFSAPTTCSTPAMAHRPSKWGSTNIYTEDAAGNPHYDWTIVDRLVDTYLARGVRPYLQLGFMPQALSSKPDPYQHEWRPGLKYDDISTGWAYPPKDYAKWAELALPVDEAQRRKIRPRRGRALVVRGLERTQRPRLLARHAGGFLQAS